jgi:hypothetical protein
LESVKIATSLFFLICALVYWLQFPKVMACSIWRSLDHSETSTLGQLCLTCIWTSTLCRFTDFCKTVTMTQLLYSKMATDLLRIERVLQMLQVLLAWNKTFSLFLKITETFFSKQ